MTETKTGATRIVASDPAEDAVRLAVEDPEGGVYLAAEAGISQAAAIILWTLAAGCVGFLFGAAWRGSQIVGG